MSAPPSKRIQLTTTFTKDEVNALDALFKAVREGGDTSVLVRNPSLANAHKKFLKMKSKTKGSES